MKITAEIKNNVFEVHKPCFVDIMIHASDSLQEGDTIQVQFPNSWTIVNGPSFTRRLQTEDPKAEHYVAVSSECDAKFQIVITPHHLNYSEGAVRHGRLMTATLVNGTIPSGTGIHFSYTNTYAPYVTETETVWIRVKGVAPDADPILKVTPGPGEYTRIIVPSNAKPGETFDVLIVSLDKFDNCSSTEFKDETVLLHTGEIIAEKLNFMGSIRVPVRLQKDGIHRFQMGNILSNPIRIGKGVKGPYWGDIHIHTKLSLDAQGTDPYTYARDVSGLDFASVTDHWTSLGEKGYDQLLQWAEEANASGQFVTLFADERNPDILHGDHNIYIRDKAHFLKYAAKPGNEPFCEPEATEESLRALDPSKVMLIPHHTGLSWRNLPENGRGRAIDLDVHNDYGLRPVMEIYSHHGQSEHYAPQHILSYEFNRMRNPERRSNASVPGGPYYAQDYWMNGRRMGVIGSSDEHSGQGGRRHGGLTAVWAEKLSGETIFDEIQKRQCYATTGERMLVEFAVDGIPMGCSGKRQKSQTLSIKLHVWGTDLLIRVEILRYRFGMDTSFMTILSESPRPETMDISYTIRDECNGNCMYYARITQQPLEWPGMAWTSPVWIDVI